MNAAPGAAVVTPRFRPSPRVISLLLFSLAILGYLPALWNGFVSFDDDICVYANPQVQQGLTLASIRWAFSTSLNGSWHPLTWLSTLLDCQLYGMSPAGHHFTSLLIHAFTTVLVFRLFLRMTGFPGRSAFVAALFAVHPLHVESVAWVSERKDVLCAFFWMLSLLAYVRYVLVDLPLRRGLSRFYLLSLFFFVCGIMSKPMIVTLPLLLLLMDWWPLKRFQIGSGRHPAEGVPLSTPLSRLFAEKIPFLLLSLVCGLMTISSQSAAGAMMTAAETPLKIRLLNTLLSYGSYARQAFWPADLSIYYPYPKAIPYGLLLASGAALAALTGIALASFRRRPALTFGWLWFVVTLLPVIGLIQVGGQAHADRYMYVPLIGISVMAAWLVGDFFAPQPHGRTINLLLAGAPLVVCLGLTLRQVTFWRDSESLYRRALAVTRNNAVAENNLADVLIVKGRFEESLLHSQAAARLSPSFPLPAFNIGEALAGQGLLDEGIAEYEKAFQRFPGNADLYERYGRLLLKKGRLNEAMEQFNRVLSLNPNHPQAHCNLGLALVRRQRFDEAALHFRESARLLPDYLTPHNNLGALLGREGRFPEAIEEFRIVLRLKPLDPVAHCNLADALSSQGRLDAAAAEYEVALKLAPSDFVAHRHLASVRIKQGRVDEAVSHLQEAIRIMPGDSQSYSELGIALGKQGKLNEALERLNQAVNLDPNNVDALCNLGVALGAKGDLDAAIAHLQAALKLRPDFTNALNNLHLAQTLNAGSKTNTP